MDWRYLWNGMWCIIITMTGVGYGDLYPVTHIGRIIGVLAALLGNLLIAVMVVSLAFTSEFTPQQRKAYELVNFEVG
jgi:voltage-gated potassium channel